MFSASTRYHVCIIDADHSYNYGYCLGGFWGGDHLYGLFSTEISTLRTFIEIGSRHYHCDLNYAFGGDVLHTVIVGQAEDASLPYPDKVFPDPGIFHDEVFYDNTHIYICSRHYHFVHVKPDDDTNWNIILVGDMFDGYFQYVHPGYGPIAGLFFDELFGEVEIPEVGSYALILQSSFS